jgi:serine/threonine-protein kinase
MAAAALMTNPSPFDHLRDALPDRYEILREVGRGGMATVYLANDLHLQRKVALKVLKPDLAATVGSRRFLHEIRVTANLQHPHILPLFDSGKANGSLYYVMPFVEGESLRDRIGREGRLPVAEVARLLRDIADGLAAAHAIGIVHRDIKPGNVLISGRHAMISDFGLAKAVREASTPNTLTALGVALGTPFYMAPEQATAERVDHRADIYSLGAVAYELLTGRPPFAGRHAQQVLTAHVTETPAPLSERLPSVPPELEQLVMRCLAKNPADRWQRAEEMLPQLELFATRSGAFPSISLESVIGRQIPDWVKLALAVGSGVAMAVAGAALTQVLSL